jgi:hypothetical protein
LENACGAKSPQYHQHHHHPSSIIIIITITYNVERQFAGDKRLERHVADELREKRLSDISLMMKCLSGVPLITIV